MSIITPEKQVKVFNNIKTRIFTINANCYVNAEKFEKYGSTYLVAYFNGFYNVLDTKEEAIDCAIINQNFNLPF